LFFARIEVLRNTRKYFSFTSKQLNRIRPLLISTCTAARNVLRVGALDPLVQGCQTRFSSGATSGKFNLKRAGPM